ncbi:MAG: spore coat protein CotJB [Oscillospiraceae bacterium]|nr:spore coat protein CotJB [Oscillospiraceae bacterium]
MHDRGTGQQLMHSMQMYGFALNDAALFLNINPDDASALDYYRKTAALLDAANKEYAQKYGPTTRGDYDGGPRWKWADGPWPWELEA